MRTSLASVRTVLPYLNGDRTFGQLAYQANGDLKTSHKVCVSVTYSASVRFGDTDKQVIYLFVYRYASLNGGETF